MAIRNAPVLREETGDCCPPGKGCNRAGPSSRDEAEVLQPLLHRTQERWWPLANPGSASLEPGFAQAPVQDADAQAHDQMHSAPGLVCSDRPEGRLLSRFDPSATQTVSTVCVRRSCMAVQGPPLRALPISPCVHETAQMSYYCGDRLSFPDAYTYYDLSLIRWLYIKQLLRTRDVTSRFLLLLVHCRAAWRWRYVFGASYFLWHLCS